jgi:hypothetical protein
LVIAQPNQKSPDHLTNTFDDFPGPNRFNGLALQRASDRSEQGRWFRRPEPTLSARHPSELFTILAHDRGGRFQPDADATTLIDIGTFGGNIIGQGCAVRTNGHARAIGPTWATVI